MLLDSNIIIYAALPQHQALRDLIAANAPAVSAVSYVETLGYHKLSESDAQGLERFFAATIILPVDWDVIGRATSLRRLRKMSLGDALIAATALIHDRTLVTRNVDDFKWVEGLRLLDPIATPT